MAPAVAPLTIAAARPPEDRWSAATTAAPAPPVATTISFEFWAKIRLRNHISDMYKILYFSLFLQHILTMHKTLLNLHSLLTPDANTARPLSHTNGTTFRRTNCQLRLKRSGIPSRLSLRRQWILSPLKAFLTVCFGRGGGLYLLFGIRLLHHN